MRLVATLWPCIVGVVALALSGCAAPTSRMTALQEENRRLAAEQQNLKVELAAANQRVARASARSQEWQSEIRTLRTLLHDHILAMIQTHIKERIVGQAITVAQTQIESGKPLPQPQPKQPPQPAPQPWTAKSKHKQTPSRKL